MHELDKMAVTRARARAEWSQCWLDLFLLVQTNIGILDVDWAWK